MSETLDQALKLADLRELIDDLYPEAGVNLSRFKQRIGAPWRGGDNPEVVSLTAKTAYDFKATETYNPWTFLTEVAGFSKDEAASYLISRAGLADTPQAKYKAARREQQEKAAEVNAEAVKARRQAWALRVQRTAPTTGSSEYFTRKGITDLFKTHRVAPAKLPDGEVVPGLVYSSNKFGRFVQLVLRDLEGNITGYQRLYDGEGGKWFVFGSKPTGSFVLLEPVGGLPKTAKALGDLELGTCEGFATGASVCMARPRTAMFCALSAGNLAPMTEALRGHYGYTHRTKSGTLKAVDLTIWADLDESGTGQQAAHLAALKSSCYVRLPKFKKGYGGLRQVILDG